MTTQNEQLEYLSEQLDNLLFEKSDVKRQLESCNGVDKDEKFTLENMLEDIEWDIVSYENNIENLKDSMEFREEG